MANQVAVAKSKPSRFRFISDIIAELKKVVWLTRREIVYLTFLVLAVTVVVALLMGAFDYGFSVLVEKVFLGQ
jgi:preprotein translocase subunit SecE